MKNLRSSKCECDCVQNFRRRIWRRVVYLTAANYVGLCISDQGRALLVTDECRTFSPRYPSRRSQNIDGNWDAKVLIIWIPCSRGVNKHVSLLTILTLLTFVIYKKSTNSGARIRKQVQSQSVSFCSCAPHTNKTIQIGFGLRRPLFHAVLSEICEYAPWVAKALTSLRS